MLYCLSEDLMNDLVAMFNHDHCKYDSTNTQLMDELVPEYCQMVNSLSLIVAAAREIRDRQTWQYASIVVRNWVSTIHPFTSDTTDLNFKFRDRDEGYWEYVYATCGAKKLFVSKSLFSKPISVIGGVPYYKIDDGLSEGEYTIDEIAKSNQHFKLNAVFPAEPRMFSAEGVEFMIPYNLIK